MAAAPGLGSPRRMRYADATEGAAMSEASGATRGRIRRQGPAVAGGVVRAWP